MRIVLLGPPGAGKGTQAKVLSNNLKLAHLSTGDMFRDAVKSGSVAGKKLSEYMQQGLLVPDETVNEIITQKLKDESIQNNFVLDGYPRTLPQAVELDKFLKSNKIPLDYVIYMQASEDVVISRLTGRRVCEKCGYNYHIKNIPPKKSGICDYDGAELYQRKDDEEETVRRRWKVYSEQTALLIDYYAGKAILREVDGDLDVDALNKYLNALFQNENLS
ncbi:MAG: adenylate kinase [Candidatus Omnitrophica bacterium]|nr:adenylate kinase [Candidatus Omnitrophota bacterium]